MLPPRIIYELVPDRPANGHRISPAMLNFMLDEYYEARGWDWNGIVKEETKRRLEII
jgi:aldehyde:ferredoxin oxidoreductase